MNKAVITNKLANEKMQIETLEINNTSDITLNIVEQSQASLGFHSSISVTTKHLNQISQNCTASKVPFKYRDFIDRVKL